MMADENEVELPEEGGKKKLMMIIIIGVVLLGGSVAGTFLFLSKEDAPQVEEMVAESTEDPAVYFPLKPEFVINYNVRKRQRFLQAYLSVMVRDKDAIDVITDHMPMVRNNLIQVFSQQDFNELRTVEGKEKLRTELKESLQSVLTEFESKAKIEQVLFLNFVMQ